MKTKKALGLIGGGIAALLAALPTQGSLEAYDTAITNDMSAGYPTAARLTSAVTLYGTNRASFNFGSTSGDATLEFILEGNPAASSIACLAVGANTASILRYEQYNNTEQLGFSGTADYRFTPFVPAPHLPTHLVFAWSATAKTMNVYINGSLTGTRTGVNASFAMPNGQGYLGANQNNLDNMTGVIYRVTVYDNLLPDAVIRRHADAFNGVLYPPIILAFAASPGAVFTPSLATLTWDVQRAAGLWVNGQELTSLPNLMVSPTVTTTYTLVASNQDGVTSAQATILVNPAPIIQRFEADRSYVPTGATVRLAWQVQYGQTYSITPNVGEVTAQTTNGRGAILIQPGLPTTYTLTASSPFGANSEQITIHPAQPAPHLVISEFMADNETSWPDEDGDYSDWIEIHNPTLSPVSLGGYSLTDDPDEPAKWAFPDISLASGGFLLVFASGKDRTNNPARLHTNFQLDKNGEYLALVGPGPLAVHAYAPVFPEQREDISYGVLSGDVALQRFLGVPTPGAANNETLPRPGKVRFSQADGLFTNTFSVSLSAPDPGAEIWFTVDGSAPDGGQGLRYTAPITISNTTRLLAVAKAYGQTSRRSGAYYVKLAPELTGYTSSLPLLVIDNFGAGVVPQKNRSGDGSSVKQVPRQRALWAAFERVNGVSSLNQAPQMISPIGIRGRGAFSTMWRKKPYSVEALDEDGAEQKVAPLGMPAHADWVLYFPDADANKDPSLLANTFAYELSRNSGHYAVRFRWVEVFLNEDGGDLRLADRRGVYALLEKVARGADRLDFERLSADGTRGGWLINVNRMDPEPEGRWPAPNGATQPWFFHTAGPNRVQETPPNALVVGDDEPRQANAFFNFDNPTGYTINTNQRAAIENWLKQFEDVLWNNALWRDPTNGYRRFIDAADFADCFILNTLTRNGDGLLLSMFPWKGNDGRLRMGPAWDYNWNSYYISGSPSNTLMHGSDRLWYKRLFADPDFLQFYIDRWWDLRRSSISDTSMAAILDGQAAEITPAKALLNGMPSATEWANRLSQMKTWLKDRANWIDSNYLRPPAFNVSGGEVPEGFQVVIHGTNGTTYFTLDGSDPRALGGTVAANAQAYQGPVTLTVQTMVQTRIKNGTNWSGLTTGIFYPPQDLTKLVITELMYNPLPSGSWTSDDLEFLELKNTGNVTLRLGLLTFTSGITFTFTNGTQLESGQFIVLARNAAALQSQRSNLVVNGIYTGRLDNGGETIRLSTPDGSTVLAVTYDDRAPWPLAADGFGFSVVARDNLTPANSENGARWRASVAPGGSPGADDPPVHLPNQLR